MYHAAYHKLTEAFAEEKMIVPRKYFKEGQIIPQEDLRKPIEVKIPCVDFILQGGLRIICSAYKIKHWKVLGAALALTLI